MSRFLILALLVFSAYSRAALVIDSTSLHYNAASDQAIPPKGPVVQTCQTKMFAEKGKMRSENSCDKAGSGGAQSSVLIWREDKGLIWIIQPEKKSYQEITKAQMEELAKAAMTKTNPFANMSPQQRAQMEKMAKTMPGLKNMMAMTKSGGYQYKPMSRIETVGKWTCKVYEASKNGLRLSQECATPLNEVIKDADNAGLYKKGLSQFWLTSPLEGREREHARQKTMGDRVVVKVATVSTVTTIKSVEKGEAPQGAYDLPAGYAKTAVAEKPEP